MKLRSYHFTPSMNKNAGGPPRSVGQLCEALARCEARQVTLITSDPQTDGKLPVSEQVSEFIAVKQHATFSLFADRFNWESISKEIQSYEGQAIMHVHGMWLRSTHEVIKLAQSDHMPVVLAPRGMAEPWAMNHKKWKKKLAWMLYQRSDFAKVTAFHATAHSEAESIRRLGFKQPIAVIPNGVELPEFRGQKPEFRGQKTALFLSRINPKKGLPMLLDVWKKLAPADWRLVIAGNDDSNHLPELERQIAELELADQVELVGPLFGDAKEQAYLNADLFVLPSYSENFGIVVAEALGYGLPVLTTTGCPWQELETEHCGWWVEPTPEGIAFGLRAALRTESGTLQAMGLRGRRLVELQYQWLGIAEQMAEFYGWILDGGQKPKFVV